MTAAGPGPRPARPRHAGDAGLGGVRRSRGGVAVAAPIAILALAIVACAGKGRDTPPAGGAPGAVTLPGGTDGRIFGVPSERGVVLIADPPDTSAWTGLADELARSGYGAIVIPFADHGSLEAATAAARELERRGALHVVFVGSGRGVAPALAAAARDAAGVVALNPPADASPPGAMPAVPSLMMAALADGPSSAAAQQLYRAAPEPRILALYPGRETAPAAFEASPELKTTFLDFLRNAFQPLSAAAR
jgi:hypothetical protein